LIFLAFATARSLPRKSDLIACAVYAQWQSDTQMTNDELDNIRAWDKRCGDNEGTFFPVTLDRRRLLGYVDELRAELAALKKPVILQ
jgi:hypothetical protein